MPSLKGAKICHIYGALTKNGKILHIHIPPTLKWPKYVIFFLLPTPKETKFAIDFGTFPLPKWLKYGIYRILTPKYLWSWTDFLILQQSDLQWQKAPQYSNNSQHPWGKTSFNDSHESNILMEESILQMKIIYYRTTSSASLILA